MTDNFELMLPDDFEITTTDGQVIRVTQEQLDRYASIHTGEGDPLWRIKAGQPKDDFREASNQLYAERKIRQQNAETGEMEMKIERIGPFGNQLAVYTLGYTRNRVYFPDYDRKADEDDRQPLCRSEDFYHPNTEFKGKFAKDCCGFNPHTRNLEAPICPMAKWGAPTEESKKGDPPPCTVFYVVFCVFSWEGQAIVAEAQFKRASTASGRLVYGQLSKLAFDKQPIFIHPLDLILRDADIGNTYMGVLRTKQVNELTEQEIADLGEAIARVEQAKLIRRERALRQPETQTAQLPASTAPTGSTVTITPTPTAPTATTESSDDEILV